MDLYNNVALVTLNCSHNSINTISVNNNPALLNADCSYNNLTTLNVSEDAALTILNCNYNELSTLNVSDNTALEALYCGYNNFPSIDVSGNLVLEDLYCAGNGMPAVDLSSNTNLRSLDCSYNQLTGLDLIANAGLIQLNCSYNQMTTLDLRTDIPLYIVQLNCMHNQLTDLNLSNAYTMILFCDTNNLQTLNIANGINNLQGFTVWANDNPELTCVQVDDAEYSNANWTDSSFILFDEGVSFSEDCAIPSAISNLSNTAFAVYPNPTNGIVYFLGTFNAQVTNGVGQVVLNNRNANSLDISNQPAGIYFITFTDDKGQLLQQSKVVKE